MRKLTTSSQSNTSPHHLGQDRKEEGQVMSICVKSLPLGTTDQDLNDAFAEFSPVNSKVLQRNPIGPSHMAMGFVNFATQEAVQRALAHKPLINGKKILILPYKPKITGALSNPAPLETEKSIGGKWSHNADPAGVWPDGPTALDGHSQKKSSKKNNNSAANHSNGDSWGAVTVSPNAAMRNPTSSDRDPWSLPSISTASSMTLDPWGMPERMEREPNTAASVEKEIDRIARVAREQADAEEKRRLMLEATMSAANNSERVTIDLTGDDDKPVSRVSWSSEDDEISRIRERVRNRTRNRARYSSSDSRYYSSSEEYVEKRRGRKRNEKKNYVKKSNVHKYSSSYSHSYSSDSRDNESSDYEPSPRAGRNIRSSNRKSDERREHDREKEKREKEVKERQEREEIERREKMERERKEIEENERREREENERREREENERREREERERREREEREREERERLEREKKEKERKEKEEQEKCEREEKVRREQEEEEKRNRRDRELRKEQDRRDRDYDHDRDRRDDGDDRDRERDRRDDRDERERDKGGARKDERGKRANDKEKDRREKERDPDRNRPRAKDKDDRERDRYREREREKDCEKDGIRGERERNRESLQKDFNNNREREARENGKDSNKEDDSVFLTLVTQDSDEDEMTIKINKRVRVAKLIAVYAKSIEGNVKEQNLRFYVGQLRLKPEQTIGEVTSYLKVTGYVVVVKVEREKARAALSQKPTVVVEDES